MDTGQRQTGANGAGGPENRRSERSRSSEKKSDGDRIFEAAGDLITNLNTAVLVKAVKRLKETSLRDLDLPPAVENALRIAGRKIQGKMEDFRELASEVKGYAASKGSVVSEKVAGTLDLPSQEDLRRLEARIRELEEENQKLKKKAAAAKPKAKAKAKSKTKSKSKSKKKTTC